MAVPLRPLSRSSNKACPPRRWAMGRKRGREAYPPCCQCCKPRPRHQEPPRLKQWAFRPRRSPKRLLCSHPARINWECASVARPADRRWTSSREQPHCRDCRSAYDRLGKLERLPCTACIDEKARLECVGVHERVHCQRERPTRAELDRLKRSDDLRCIRRSARWWISYRIIVSRICAPDATANGRAVHLIDHWHTDDIAAHEECC